MASSRPWFASDGPLWGLAIGVALIVIMLLAVLGPRLFGVEETAWWVTVLVGVAIGAAVVIWGYVRRGSGETRDMPPPEQM